MAKTKHEKQVEKTVKWAEKQDSKAKRQEAPAEAEPEPAGMTHEITPDPQGHTFTNKVGRPPKYCGEKTCDAAKLLASKGFIDLEIAQSLMITESTLYEWKKEHPEFSEAITQGKALIDDMVEKSLFNRAVGCSIKETKVSVTKEGDVIETEIDRNFPPDPTSMIFWLKNRRPKDWRDKREVDFTSPLTIEMGEADQGTL